MRYIAGIVFSHAILYWVWLCATHNGGDLLGLGEFIDLYRRVPSLPTLTSVGLYSGFVLVQAYLAAGLPLAGPVVRANNRRYLCNGVSCWYTTLGLLWLLHTNGWVPLRTWVDHFGPLLSTAVVCGNLVAAAVFLDAFMNRTQKKGSDFALRDFFLGVSQHPRVGELDIKMFCEIRVSWMLLFTLCLSCAAKQHADHGVVTTPMLLVLLTQFLYTNACMKGEECIPTTWDIAHEHYGWMLAFWNLAGVPFLYCLQALYLCHAPPFEHGALKTVLLVVSQCFAYWMWDTANSQKNRYRMMQLRTYVPRVAPPQFSYGTLQNPRTLKIERGTLLVDGWWRHLRKPHYTADILMAAGLGFACGGASWLPYIYVSFMTPMLLHRARRDEQRMRDKYGEDGWKEYTETVPWVLVPHLY